MKLEAPLLAVNLNRHSHIIIILRIPILWFFAIRYSFALVWLTFYYAKCLRLFYNKCDKRRNTLSWRILSVYRLSLPLKQIVKLFWPIQLSNLFAKYHEDCRYKSIYYKLRELPKPSLDVVDAPKAHRLQAILMQDAFKRYLALHLSNGQANILGYFGGVSIAIKDFLEECGCPTIPLKYDDLKKHLPRFIERCKILQTCSKWTDISEQKRRNRIMLEKIIKEIVKMNLLEMSLMRDDVQKSHFNTIASEIQFQAITGLVTLVNTVETMPDTILNEAIACINQNHKTTL